MAGRAAVGLDIGATAVRGAEVAHGKGASADGATLQRFGQVAVPPGAVRDGEVLDPRAVTTAIRQLWGQTKFSTKRVVVGVANQRVIVRQVDLPWLSPQELKASLAFQVADFIPMPVEEAILDFHPLEEFVTTSGGRMLRVLLVAASRDMVTAALTAVQDAGLKPTVVDLTPFAVLRSLAEPDLGLAAAEAEAVVEIGADVTNILVHTSGVPRFVRILLMGGDDITEAVAERFGVPAAQAEEIKRETGLSTTAADSTEHPARGVIETAGGRFVDEVRGSLDYYLAQPIAVHIRRLVLTGGGSQLPGLAQRLGQATRLPVDVGSPLPSMTIGKTGLSPEQLRSVEPVTSVPIGLALGAAGRTGVAA